MSNIRIRQICLVAHDLDRVQQQLDAVFGIEVAHRDPGVGNYGLHNVLIPVGNQLLEIVAPKEGEHETPGGRFLKRRGGDGGYMVIMQVPKAAYAGYEEHVASLGVRLVAEPGKGLEHAGGMQLHPKDVPGAIPELRWNADEDRSDGAWWPAGDDWQRAKHTEIVDGIWAAELQSADPAAMAARWGEVLDEPVASDADGNPMLALDGSDIRFVPLCDGRPEGLGGLDLSATDTATAFANAEAAGCRTSDDLITIGGMRLRLV
ncbi:MAG TPA: VOC family protein [Dehalococcoidia bacterium]|nr:VOC family protein [Dehalococcoidia bacterium]